MQITRKQVIKLLLSCDQAQDKDGIDYIISPVYDENSEEDVVIGFDLNGIDDNFHYNYSIVLNQNFYEVKKASGLNLIQKTKKKFN